MSTLDVIDVEILRLLRDGQPSISEMAASVSRSGPVVWARLRNLADRGLVTLPPKGRSRSYRITIDGREFLDRYDNVSYSPTRLTA